MFTRASKSASRLRLGICGTSGSGKTFSSLSIATALGKRIAVIDTEYGSAAKYSDIFEFDVLNLDTFEAEKFTEGIRAAERAGYDVIIIDSLSHAWMGTGGTLDQVSEAKRRVRNEFTAWRDPSKQHQDLIESIIHARLHVIATMRSKTEYVMEEYQGKKVPKKIGMAPVQRDGMEYEFDVVGDMQDGTLVISKTRCPILAGKSYHHPGREFGEILRHWLGEIPAEPTPAPEPATAPAVPCDHPADLRDRFAAVCEALELNPRDQAMELLARSGYATWDALPATFIEQAIVAMTVAAGYAGNAETVTAQHPAWSRLMAAAKSAGLDPSQVCGQLMTEHDTWDTALIPPDYVIRRAIELENSKAAV